LAGRNAGKLNGGGADQQTGGKYRQTLHERSPPMAAFGWVETYHRDTRRKSVFHAAVALCDISFSLPPITHAPARLAPREADRLASRQQR
jgi:hypothetical protein